MAIFRFSYVRVIALSSAGGLLILLWATGIIPYYLRENSLRTYLSTLQDSDAKALFAAAEAFIAQEGAGKERFRIQVTNRNRTSIPPELLRLEPQTILGSPNSLAFLYDGVGDSETAITLRNDQGWTIFAHFGPYFTPLRTYYPQNTK